MNNRQLAALETKKNLLAAAKKIIREKGLVNTSVAEIAKAAGVANGTFYTYFKRKEDIVYELGLEIYEELIERAKNYEGTFLERLAFFMTSFSADIEKSSLKLCQEWVRNTVNPNLVENPEHRNKIYMDINTVKSLLEGGVARGELKADTPVDVLAHTIIDILYGQMLCWNMTDGAYSFKERTKEFCNIFLKSLMTPYIV